MHMEEMYKKHSSKVFKYLMSLTNNNRDLSEEITQETFYQAMKSIDNFKGNSNLTTWLCAIAKNQLHTYYRKNPQMNEIEDNTVSKENLEDQIISDIGKIDLLKKLHLLKEPFKEVMYLRVFGNLSFKEIGEVLNQSENWARVSFYRGKEKLRKEMCVDGE